MSTKKLSNRSGTLIVAVWMIVAGIAHRASGGVGEWARIEIEGGSVWELSIAPSAPTTVYAVSLTAGVFRSTDNGATWVGKRAGLEAAGASLFNARRIAVHPTDPDVAYYSSLAQGLFETTDGGDTWASLDDVLMDDGGGLVSVSDVAIPASSPTTLYVGGSDGLFQSTDGGASWDSLNDVLTDDGGGIVSIADVGIDPSAPATVWVAGSDGVFQSTDGGASWDSLNDVLTDDGGGTVDAGFVAIDPATPATVYVGGRDGLFKTTDGGAMWASLNTVLEAAAGGTHGVRALAIDPAGSGALVAAFEHLPDGLTLDRSVLRSDDGGASWADIGAPLAITSVRHLVIDPASAQTIWASTAAGVYRTTDGGTSWSERNHGLDAVLVNLIVPQPELPAPATKGVLDATLFAVDTSGAGVFKSTDGGTSWASSNVGLSNRGVQDFAVSPSNPQVLYLTDSLQFSKSTDGGETWVPDIADMTPFFEVSGPTVLALAVHPTDPDTLLAGNFGAIFSGTVGEAGLFRSTDGGAHWERIFLPATPSGSTFYTYQPTGVAFDPVNPDLILSGSIERESGQDRDGPVRRSADGGTSWATVLTGLGFARPSFTPGASWVTATSFLNLSGGIQKSTDGGVAWQAANTGLPEPVRIPFGGVLAEPGDANALYVLAGSPSRVQVSTDAGSSWRPFADTGVDPGIGMRSLALIQSGQQITLYAGFNGGVYSFTTGRIFADGFESGDLTAWSSSVP